MRAYRKRIHSSSGASLWSGIARERASTGGGGYPAEQAVEMVIRSVACSPAADRSLWKEIFLGDRGCGYPRRVVPDRRPSDRARLGVNLASRVPGPSLPTHTEPMAARGLCSLFECPGEVPEGRHARGKRYPSARKNHRLPAAAAHPLAVAGRTPASRPNRFGRAHAPGSTTPRQRARALSVRAARSSMRSWGDRGEIVGHPDALATKVGDFFGSEDGAGDRRRGTSDFDVHHCQPSSSAILILLVGSRGRTGTTVDLPPDLPRIESQGEDGLRLRVKSGAKMRTAASS